MLVYWYEDYIWEELEVDSLEDFSPSITPQKEIREGWYYWFEPFLFKEYNIRFLCSSKTREEANERRGETKLSLFEKERGA